MKKKSFAVEVAEITSLLFHNCQVKELKCARMHGISPIQSLYLRILHAKHGLTVNQLASEMKVTSGRITRITDSLVEKRLVVREVGENDRRIFNLHLTPTGKTLVPRILEDYEKIHESILSEFPEEHRSSLLTVLQFLNASVEKWISRK